MIREFELGGFLKRSTDCLKQIILQPSLFFSTPPTGGGYRHPTLFLLLCSAVAGVLSCLFGGPWSDLVGYPFFALTAVWVAASIMAYVRREFFDVAGSYEETYRIVAYGSSLILFSPLPLLGWPAGIYGLAVIVVGMKTIHGLSLGRALVATILTFFCMNLLRFIFPWIASRSPFGLFSG
jgi:hypothetical protein